MERFNISRCACRGPRGVRKESGLRSLDSGLRRSDGAGITIIFPLRSHRADSLIRGVQRLQARRLDWDNQAA